MGGVCEGECMGDETLTLTRCHSCGLPQLYEVLEGRKSVCDRAYNLKGIKGKIYVFILFVILLKLISWHDALAYRSGEKR